MLFRSTYVCNEHGKHTVNSESGYFGYIPLLTRDRLPSRLHKLPRTSHCKHTANSESGYFGYIPLRTRDRHPSRLHKLQPATLTSLFSIHSFDKMHVLVFNSGLAAPRCTSADIRYAPISPFPKCYLISGFLVLDVMGGTHFPGG